MSQDGSSGCMLRLARLCKSRRFKPFYNSLSTGGDRSYLWENSTWLCRELESAKTCYSYTMTMPRYWIHIYMKYNLYQYLYITRFYSKRSTLQPVQRLRINKMSFTLCVLHRVLSGGGRRPPFLVCKPSNDLRSFSKFHAYFDLDFS